MATAAGAEEGTIPGRGCRNAQAAPRCLRGARDGSPVLAVTRECEILLRCGADAIVRTSALALSGPRRCTDLPRCAAGSFGRGQVPSEEAPNDASQTLVDLLRRLPVAGRRSARCAAGADLPKRDAALALALGGRTRLARPRNTIEPACPRSGWAATVIEVRRGGAPPRGQAAPALAAPHPAITFADGRGGLAPSSPGTSKTLAHRCNCSAPWKRQGASTSKARSSKQPTGSPSWSRWPTKAAAITCDGPRP